MTTAIDFSPVIQELPSLSSHYAISPREKSLFQKNGHVLLKEVASPPEIAAYRPVLSGAVERYKANARSGAYIKKLEERDTYTKAFVQVDNLWRTDEGAKQFVLARRFGQIAADLLEVDGVRVYLDQGLYKEPGGGYTPWHQDQFYWPLETDKTVSMWMPLVDIGMESGTLAFGDGSHLCGPRGSLAISDQSETHFKAVIRQHNIHVSIHELSAGDATFHTGWTLHKAPGNSTAVLREVMTIVFFADGTRIMEPKNEKHAREIGKWLDGRKPGELADGPANPLVFSRKNDCA